MNFKSAKPLIDRVSRELASYIDQGYLDTGDFYRYIKEMLSDLNIPAFSPVHSIISLNGNYKVRIPDDMYQIWSVWRYKAQTVQTEDVDHYQGQNRWLVFKDQCIEKESDCPVVYKEDNDIIVSKWYIRESGDTISYKYKNDGPIQLKNFKLNDCSDGCPALNVKNSPHTASMDSNYFYFNFTDGSIYLQYFTMMKDEHGVPMIPDVVQIERAVENYIIYRSFRQLYYDTTLDVVNRMQIAKLENQETFDKAKTYVKFPTFQEVVNIGNSARGKYKMFELGNVR